MKNLNDPIKPLIIRPHIALHESIAGYALRLAESNGYSTMHLMLSYAGVDEVSLRANNPPFYVINQIIGRDIDSEIAALPYKGNHNLTSYLREIPAIYINKRNPKICPECIAETGSISHLFDLKFYIGCSIHNKFNIKKCSSCNALITWNRPGILKCKCNQEFQASSNFLPSDISAIMSLIEWKFNQSGVIPQLLIENNYPIDILKSISPLIILNIISRIKQRPFLHMLNTQHEDTTFASFEAFHHMMRNWPNGFYEYLEEHQDNASLSLTIRFQTFFRAFCANNQSNDLIDFLNIEFIKFGNYHWKKSTIDTRYLQRGNVEREVFGVNSLAKHLNVRLPTILEFIKSGLIKGHDIIDNGMKRTIFYSSELPFKPWNGTTYNQRDAASYLEISPYILRMLVNNGILTKKHLAHGTRSFAKVDLDEFIKTITSSPMAFNYSFKPISLKHILAKKLKKNDFIISLFKAIISNELRPISGDSLSTLMLNSDDFHKFCLLNNFTTSSSKNHNSYSLF